VFVAAVTQILVLYKTTPSKFAQLSYKIFTQIQNPEVPNASMAWTSRLSCYHH